MSVEWTSDTCEDDALECVWLGAVLVNSSEKDRVLLGIGSLVSRVGVVEETTGGIANDASDDPMSEGLVEARFSAAEDDDN